MKRIITMVLATSLIAAPALAAVPAPSEGPEKPAAATTTPGFRLALDDAARAIIGEDVASGAATPVVLQSGKNGGKVLVGVLLILGGAAVIVNGADLWDSEGDIFGRKKNDDSYVSYGVGAISAFLGVIVLRGGLRGDDW